MTRSLRSLLLCVVGVLPPLLAAAGPARAESLVADGFVKGLTIAQCSGLAQSRDGSVLAAVNNTEVVIWDGASRELRGRAGFSSADGARAVAISPDNQLVAVGITGAIQLYSAADASVVRKIALPPTGGVNALAFSPDGKLLAASTGGEDGKYTIYGDNIFDVASGKRLHQLARAEVSLRSTTDLAFSPDGKYLAIAIANKQKGIELYDTATWQRKAKAAYAKDATRLAFTPDGAMLAVGSIDRMVRIHMIVEKAVALAKQFVAHQGAANNDAGYITGLAFTPDGTRLVTGSDDLEGVRLWDRKTWTQLASSGHKVNRLTGLVVAPDGKSLLVGGMFAARLQRFRIE